MPRYSDALRLEARQKVQFPANAQPIALPQRLPRDRIWVYERDGKRHAALFHKGQWMKVVRYPRIP